jgi:cyclophilin family peptidyl-prolyl cis-trans isomerase
MLDRIWKVHSRSDRHGAGSRPSSKHSGRQPLVEVLEGRQLLTASLAPIASVTVPAQLGYQLALDGSGSTSSNQTYTATSSNPNIKVSVAPQVVANQGQYWTVTVSHTPANNSDVTINNESMTFQLFGDLTPQTVARITTLTNDNYYTTATLPGSSPAGPGKYFPRITSVSASGFSVLQGGSGSPTSTDSSSGITPLIATEPVQQLAFTGQSQIAMANTGAADSTDAQFFITNGTLSQSVQQAFDFNYTLFGQLVSGQQTVTDLSKVAVQNNTPPSGQTPELSQPITPVVIDSVAFSSTNPNGVLHIDTTGATAGQTATITVTATDPTDHTTATQSFTVTVGAYNGPADPIINFVPLAQPVSVSTNVNAPVPVQLLGTSGYPDTSKTVTLTYQLLSQPAHGTISQFSSSTGALVYTPTPNYSGPDTFQYEVSGSGPQTTAPNPTTSLPQTVSVQVGGPVHLIDNNVLVVTPPPRTDHGTDNIDISQQANSNGTGAQNIVVTVNGVTNMIQPLASSLLQIIVFGGKASTDIQVDPSVSPTIPITLDGGHGGHNVIQAGAGPTREHGWFGHTLLIGGTGPDALIGRKGFVRFKPTTTTNLIYAGVIKPRFSHRTVAPSGTFYRFEKGRLVPVLTT